MGRNSTFPGMASPAAGFDQPFEMLAACHDRVRRSLDLLQRLLKHLHTEGGDAMARDAARDVLRYFDLAAPAHHEDEERHVVPLLAQGTPDERAAAQRMLDDHLAIRAHWSALAPLLASVADGHAPDLAALGRASDAFCRVHDAHLALEDTLAFPHAREHLRPQGDAALQAMGQEMAARRGVRGPGG